MTKDSMPFPPLVDVQSASWPLYGHEANTEIALRNNHIVAGLSEERIEFGDHIYGFPATLKSNLENIE